MIPLLCKAKFSCRDLIYVPKKGVDLLVSAAQKSVCIWDLDKWRGN